MNAARAKVEREGACRMCGSRSFLEAAHLCQKSQSRAARGYDDPDNIVPLCRSCHTQFDAHALDVLAALTLEEQVRLVQLSGGIQRAYRRAIGKTPT